MLKCFQRGHTVHWIPIKALVDEVEELGVLTLLEHTVERFRIRKPTPTTRVRHNYGHEGVFLEKHVTARAQFNDVVRRDTLDLHDVRELLCFILARKQWVTCVKLGHDAAERPHVNAGSVRDAQNNLRCAIKS